MVEVQPEPYTEYLDFTVFKETFGSNIHALSQAGKEIDQLPKWDLENLIHLLYGKWPHNRKEKVWRLGIKRAIQARFYKELYRHTPNQHVLKRDAEVSEMLSLSEEAPPETKIRKKPKEKKITMETTPTQPKPKKEKSELSKKISAMSLEEVIKWATDLGIPADKIEKHKNKPLGLAKMNISNMIKAKVE